MHKNTLWLVLALVCIYFTLVFCEEQQQQEASTDLEDSARDLLKSDSTDLQEDEARTRRRHRHHLYSMWGWHALAIAYLVKIKIVVVAFFVGSAIYLGLRYFWPQKCHSEIILDHPPPSFSHHHDHIPYSSDHSDIISSSWGPSSSGGSFEPYSAYAGSYGGSDSISYGGSDTISDPIVPESHTFRRKREVKVNEEQKPELESRQMPIANEEQIGNFMFMFLGLDSKACRSRFICEMEFRSKANPLTAMAFRIIGRSFFEKYTNDHNELGKAHSYHECAAVNSECVFIENETENAAEDQQDNQQEETQEESVNNEAEPDNAAIDLDDSNVDLPTEDSNNSLENNNIEERANYHNLEAERRNSYWRRLRGDRHLKI